jgi:hypothetical protein
LRCDSASRAIDATTVLNSPLERAAWPAAPRSPSAASDVTRASS